MRKNTEGIVTGLIIKKKLRSEKKTVVTDLHSSLFSLSFSFLSGHDAYRIMVGCRSLGCGALYICSSFGFQAVHGGDLLLARVWDGSRR